MDVFSGCKTLLLASYSGLRHHLQLRAYKSLASANVMANDLVDHLQGSSRHALLELRK
jgi:hypothetical protein